MPIDSNIALGIKPPDILSADERAGNALKIQSGQMENQINQYKLSDYLKTQKADEDLQSFYKSNPNPTGEQLRGQGYVKQGYDADKFATEQTKANTDNTSANLKLQHEMADYFASATGAVAQTPSYENAVSALQDSVKKGYISLEDAQGQLQKLPQDAAGIRQWALQHLISALSAKDQLPKLSIQDAGGRLVPTSQDIYGNVTEGAGAIDKTLTPDQFNDNATKPFQIVNGQLVPNKAVQDYEASKSKPASIQEYDFAKKQGFTGSFADFQASAKPNKSVETSTGLRKEFDDLPEVKSYKLAKTAYKSIEDASKRNTTDLFG